MRRIPTIVSAIALAAIAAHAAASTTAAPLMDQRGVHFTFDDLRGHPTVLTFISAHCTDACPLIEGQIAQAAAHERSVHGRLRFVTLSLDPQRDSIADLRRIAGAFDADPTYWRLARATPERTRELMQIFGVVAARDGDGYETSHTTLLYLLDRSGRYAGSVLPSTHLISQLAGAESL
jgi:protein SCO1/2